MNAPSNPTVAAQVAGLPSLPMKELWALWDRYFPRRPNKTNRAYLEARIAYKLQEEAYGGLSAATKERLIAIGRKHSKIKSGPTRSEFHFAPGTTLIREWGDRDHQVTVTAEGRFEYAGQTYKSLSAVARQITGAHWSGPLFFGLRKAVETTR
ncbi:DUF2924 domain-containing protein [Methylolobus aquaticus]|nr:DUF2924 domain-containing protein [Methylolobus aquaticus]